MFAKALLLVLVVASSPLCAQETRKSLPGVNGFVFDRERGGPRDLAFGSTLASAQEWAGDNVKLERGRSSDGRAVNVLFGSVLIYDTFFLVQFIFGDTDRLIRVNFTMFFYVGFHCKSVGKRVIAQHLALYGPLDSDIIDDKRQQRETLMTFGDGGAIRVSYGFGLPSCLVNVSFANAEGRTTDLKSR